MRKIFNLIIGVFFVIISEFTFASQNNNGPTIKNIADNILGQNQESASDIVILMMAVSATLGSAFALIAVLKFKQHKDNPQQTHLGQPFSLFLIAVLFIWLPYYLNETGYTLTGRSDANDRIEIGETSSLLCPENDPDALGCPSNNN
tara:strand:- start:4024 stop:4464 length:441 start_codon:yes stop_codon:yes gene_type:complete